MLSSLIAQQQASNPGALALWWAMMTPLAGALILMILPSANRRQIRGVTLLISVLAFCLSLLALSVFDFTKAERMQLTWQFDWITSFGLIFGFGVDSISLWLVLLTTFLMPIIILGSFSSVENRIKEFFVWLLILETAMVGVFVATDIIFFYICFEFTLVPLYFLIGIYGSTQRLKAARVFFLYTFTGSMLTFAGVLYVAWFAKEKTGSWSFAIAHLTDIAADLSASQQAWVLAAMLAGFAVKVPLWPVHTWLPLAHTEAPTAGSVILAGVLLKLGTYALLRLAIPMTPDAVVQYAPLIGVLAVTGILYTALICWVQKDMKKLIAYSSVSHMGFCVLGMFALNTIGVSGSVMYMINHGLSTGALFLCVGMIYERFHTRQMRDVQGLAHLMPVWSFFMVFFCLASVGLPGLNGFIGEFLTLMGAFTATDILGPGYAVAAGFGLIFGAIYILYMVGRVVFGPLKVPGEHAEVRDLGRREIFTLVPLAIACLWLGLYPGPVLDTLERPINKLTAAARHISSENHDRWSRLEPAEKSNGLLMHRAQPPVVVSCCEPEPDR